MSTIYLPVSDRRETDRADARLRRAGAGLRAHALPASPQPADASLDLQAALPELLIGEREHRLYPLDPINIDYIQSDGNYVHFRTATSEYLSRDTLKRLAVLLDRRGFIRIERSLLVNVRAIAYAEPVGRGSFAFTLASGRRLRSSATYREAILRVLPLVQRLLQHSGR